MTRYATKFWGIFSEGRLTFSNLNGMAFLFDTRHEARSQMRELQKSWPEGKMEVKAALLIEETL